MESPVSKVLLKVIEVTTIFLIWQIYSSDMFVRSEIIGGLQDLPANIKAVLAQDDKVCLSQIDGSSLKF